MLWRARGRWFEFIYAAYDLNKVNKLLSENEKEKGMWSEIVAAEHKTILTVLL